jgi:uncharacterized protein YegL
MPKIDVDLQQHKTQGGAFNYSATRLTDLGATEYTLVNIVSDVSGSVTGFKKEMEEALKKSIEACKHSPRADNLMIRHIMFNDSVNENHGFKLLSQVNTGDYDGSLNPMGGTALFDGTANAIQSTQDYAKQLVDASFNVNAVVFIITDGDDNSSHFTTKMVKDSIDKIRKSEALESIVTILIGVNVNDPYISKYLANFKQDAGIDQYVELDKADKSALAKLAAFVSKSISAQSHALGTGGPSKALTSQSLTI